MLRRIQMAGATTFIVICTMVAFSATEVHASGKSQDQITQFMVNADQLRQSDTQGVADKEISLLNAWLQQAQASLTARDRKEVERLLRRCRYQTQHIKALISMSEAQTRVRELQDRKEKVEAEIRKNENEITQLNREREEVARQEAEISRGTGMGGDVLKSPGL